MRIQSAQFDLSTLFLGGCCQHEEIFFTWIFLENAHLIQLSLGEFEFCFPDMVFTVWCKGFGNIAVSASQEITQKFIVGGIRKWYFVGF